MKFKIVKEPSLSKEYIFFNLYKDDEMLSSHIEIEDALKACTKAEKLSKIKPEIVYEKEIK